MKFFVAPIHYYCHYFDYRIDTDIQCFLFLPILLHLNHNLQS